VTLRPLVRTVPARKRRKKAKRGIRIAMLWPGVRSRRRASRAFRRAPGLIKALIVLSIVVSVWFPLNWTYQVIRKPSELLFPVSGTLNKTAPETWRQYGPLFEQYSTARITPELLAALAQVEGSGNPVAQTYWRWSWTTGPFDLYRPASSSVGMYQMTNSTFAEARRYCIRQHVVVDEGPWKDRNSCWFNSLYTRVLPSHAVELTAAYLDRRVAGILALRHGKAATVEQQQELAAVIHLCGAGAGDAYARRGMRLVDGQQCGDHSARDYVARVTTVRRVFEGLRAANPRS
jgi:hypothetical protein